MGSFLMEGGSICGNNGYNGGGVVVEGPFTMKAGSIKNNTGTKGSGIYLTTSSRASFKLGGSATVESNIVYCDWSFSRVCPKITIAGDLKLPMPVIQLATYSEIVTAWKEGYIKYEKPVLEISPEGAGGGLTIPMVKQYFSIIDTDYAIADDGKVVAK
jgi:hypothetical protein